MKRNFIIIFLAFILSGCISVKTPEPSDHFSVQSYSTRAKILANLQAWGVDGAFSIQHNDQRPILASYVWRQLGKAAQIRVSSALDLYNINIIKRNGSVSLSRGNKAPYTGRSAEIVMQQALGWSLPIDNMIYWIKGVAAPGPINRKQTDAYGHLTFIQQQGWQIQYNSYKNVSGIDLPQVIYMMRPGFKLKIVMKQWYLLAKNYPDER